MFKRIAICVFVFMMQKCQDQMSTEKLRSDFDQIDLNKDGYLSSHELRLVG